MSQMSVLLRSAILEQICQLAQRAKCGTREESDADLQNFLNPGIFALRKSGYNAAPIRRAGREVLVKSESVFGRRKEVCTKVSLKVSRFRVAAGC
jgi:hypothetical protein